MATTLRSRLPAACGRPMAPLPRLPRTASLLSTVSRGQAPRLSTLRPTLPKPHKASPTFRHYISSRSDTPPAPSLDKPSSLTDGESAVWDRLAAELAPTRLVVQDISGGCGTMYGIEIASARFCGLSLLRQQRLVNAALGALMQGWHGLQLKTQTP